MADKDAQRGAGQNSWLNISMDAALGFRANVFQVTRSGGQGGKKSSSSSASISVHPQAAPVECRHTLEVLISLAKGFPVHFLPGAPTASASGSQTGDSGEAKKQSKPQEFWETLLKLDRECWTSKKGKSVVRSHSSVSIKVSEEEEASSTSLSFSAFGHLLSMLSSPVIKRSSLLTDKLLRLLSLISLLNLLVILGLWSPPLHALLPGDQALQPAHRQATPSSLSHFPWSTRPPQKRWRCS